MNCSHSQTVDNEYQKVKAEGKFTAQIVSRLPNRYPLIFGFIHFITRLHIEGFVERCEVHQRSIHPPFGWRVRVRVYVHAKELISCFYTPYSGYRDKETLIGREAIEFRRVFSL